MYISEKIGEEYKKWQPGERVFIGAPTGSGKTTFVLEVLLKYAIENRRKILYLVNRKNLKKQIEEKVMYLATSVYHNYNVKNFIDVETYQSLEERLQMFSNIPNLSMYFYIICDETHYFMKDALYNTNTDYSYRWINMHENDRVLIYISATINEIKKCIEGTYTVGMCYSEQYKQEYKNRNSHFYFCEKKYDNLNIKFFKDIKDIPALIKTSKEKWLIFYNDYNGGRQLAKELKQSNEDAVFVCADYELDSDEYETVETIIQKENMSHRIIIATSIIDNGISVHDQGLRNMVIIAENEVDFIQMLGRKREDGKKVNLYLYLGDKTHFVRRMQKIRMIEQALDECKHTHSNMIPIKLMQHMNFYKCARRFLSYGLLYDYDFRHIGIGYRINGLSECELIYEKNVYKQILDKYESDKVYAFGKLQLEWLGIDSNTIEELVIKNKDEQIELYKTKIEEKIIPFLDKELNQNQNKALKKEVSDDMRSLLKLFTKPENEDLIYILNEEIRKPRNLTVKVFNNFMEVVKMEYVMYGGNKTPYVIRQGLPIHTDD